MMEEIAGSIEGGGEQRELTQLEREITRERWRERGDRKDLCASITTVVGDLLGHLAAL